MKIIQDGDKSQIAERLSEMVNPVKIINFTQEIECEYCKETRWLFEDLSFLSGKLSLEVCNFQIDKEKVETYRIDKIPATVILGEKDYGIRFYGIPSGFEFAGLLDDIISVSRRDSGLSISSKNKLKELRVPLHIQVFVTPT